VDGGPLHGAPRLAHRAAGRRHPQCDLRNIAELIIAFFALQAGLVEVVKASLTGSIIGNLLLVLGASVLIGGLRHGTQTFSARIAASNAALLLVAVIGLFVPAVFAFTSGEGRGTVTEESVLVAIALIVGYALSLVYAFTNPDATLGGHGAPEGHVLMTAEEEYRHLVPGTCWRRKGWTVIERRLVDVLDRAVLGAPADLLTGGLPQPFTTGDLAVELRRPRRTAQHLAYCLARAGVVEAVGKRAHAIEYRIAVPR
jgi:hypothetical protein